jgi:phosphoribosylglycinamide formyltransferase 2
VKKKNVFSHEGDVMAQTSLEKRLKILKEAEEYKKEFESKLSPLEKLDIKNPITFISVGGGELGDLAVTAAKRLLGGVKGGVKTVVFDRYEGFPAQDSADFYECFDMLNGDLLEENIKKYVPNPSQPHVIYLEIERIDTVRACQLGIREGYRVMSTPYGPLICMDRHLTKLMFDKLNLPMVDWDYAESQDEIKKIAKDFGLPVIIKPVMTSSGHGTTIAKTWEDVEKAYDYALKHARGMGGQVTVEKYLPRLKEEGTEIMQLAIRHFDENGKIVTRLAPPVEHRRPGATYHESWLPATIPENLKLKCWESAKRIAEFIGGLGVFAVEQFVLDGEVYNNEVANRPHDTGMITRWMLNMDEGALQLYSTLGLQISLHDLELSRKDVYGVAHVVLAPDFKVEEEVPVEKWDLNEVKRYMKIKGYRGDLWYFGKPKAYPHRRMGLAVGFHENLEEARRIAEDIAHYTEKNIFYRLN